MGIFKRNKISSEDTLVPILFGEISLSDMHNLLPDIASAIEQCQNEIAKELLIIQTGNAESRIQILAWNELRKMGYKPDKSIEKKVLGYIIEVGLKGGVDYLAVYNDNTARYYNFSGAKVIYEKCNENINTEIQKLLSSSKKVVDQIGVWDNERRKPPTNGMTRINFLTPIGLHFGEAPMAVLGNDQLAKDVIQQSIVVMKLLTTYKGN